MLEVIPMSLLMIVIDYMYLSYISCYFKKQIKHVQGTDMKLDLLAAIICYFFLCLGLYYFVVSQKKSVFDAFLLGLVIYCVYETTNKAIITNWKWKTVLIDGVWGGILFAIVTFLTYKVMGHLK